MPSELRLEHRRVAGMPSVQDSRCAVLASHTLRA
jgi:hypothetical protein